MHSTAAFLQRARFTARFVRNLVVRQKNIKKSWADKDEKGKSVSGSRKKKIVNYINSLDLSIPQKAILIRQEYSNFNDYNNQIVEYVSELNISYEEKVNIIEQLDMTVGSDGRVYWK